MTGGYEFLVWCVCVFYVLTVVCVWKLEDSSCVFFFHCRFWGLNSDGQAFVANDFFPFNFLKFICCVYTECMHVCGYP